MSNKPKIKPSKRARRPQPEERRRQFLVAGGIGVIVVGVVVGLILLSGDAEDSVDLAELAPTGTATFDDLSQGHVDGDVTYETTPPVGGDHAGVWQNCGFYPDPIIEEQGVHSLEHGAVWITFAPDLPDADRQRLAGFASDEYVLVSPFEGLADPVVASAWGLQLRLDSVSDPRLVEFVDAFAGGPQSPEPGAPCSGGVGTPSAP